MRFHWASLRGGSLAPTQGPVHDPQRAGAALGVRPVASTSNALSARLVESLPTTAGGGGKGALTPRGAPQELPNEPSVTLVGAGLEHRQALTVDPTGKA